MNNAPSRLLKLGLSSEMLEKPKGAAQTLARPTDSSRGIVLDVLSISLYRDNLQLEDMPGTGQALRKQFLEKSGLLDLACKLLDSRYQAAFQLGIPYLSTKSVRSSSEIASVASQRWIEASSRCRSSSSAGGRKDAWKELWKSLSVGSKHLIKCHENCS